ncbi:unnamed protein product [Paramecium sonneborni]|uniref:Uncharacterized protein n=1 Tax=Paramecium sonneborni TaxID=65129 RepID=A0A8S1QWW6_9CILI|nr:unnamed protein product [Paramecium sonneborni]
MKTECLHNSNNKAIVNLLKQNKCKTFTYHTTQTEIREDFYNRQKDYEKLYKYYYNTKKVTTTTTPKNSNYSSAAIKIKKEFLQKRQGSKKFFIFNEQHAEQQRSIKIITEFFRNQKKVVQDKQVNCEPKMRQFNLVLILAIALPLLCLLTVFAEIR